MDESKPHVPEATDVVLRSTVVDSSLVFDEMGRGVREVLDALDIGEIPDEVLTELRQPPGALLGRMGIRR